VTVSNFESRDNFYKCADSGSNLMNDYEVHKYLRNLVFKAYHHIRFVILLIHITTLGT